MEPVRLEDDVEEFGKDLGVVHEMIVTGRKVGAGREFYSRLAHDEALFCQIADQVLGRSGLTEPERAALEILGLGKVLGYRDVCRVWKAEMLDAEPVMPEHIIEDVLRECAAANAEGTADWRLAYVQGLSLRQQYEIQGKSRKKQPCFDPDYTWWLESQQDEWATKTVEPGYRLMNFAKSYANMTWQAQTEAIAKLGDTYSRAEEQAVAEICFSSFLLNNGERLLQNWYHWGHLQTADGDRVCVGDFDQRGFRVDRYWDDRRYDDLGVVLARKAA